MTTAAILGATLSNHPMRMAFLRWQCHTRQLAMRQSDGRPDDAMTPAVWLEGAAEPMGHVITLMNKNPAYSVIAELEHMARKTNHPAQRRDQAIRFLSATYYQKAAEFSDILTATFPPGSPGAAALRDAEHVRLVFEAYSQRFDLRTRVWRLAEHNPLHRSTMAHNILFNPAIPPGTEVLGFEPDWENCTSEPPV